ncbi:hypothetical protein EVAR_83770_1 [Eumeta japonica]|uniref:Uncharacterized protein n=1 Tax=Eumeta variegata TaxID=151549 RepID=A0A4C1WFA8_EUMVA|nr:hypothetical protein EVAR_83770_1 [Eumeta japonica]
MMRADFNYNSQIDYSMYGYIGMMDAICPYCDAANFQRETPGMCCANGKVRLPALETPPEHLNLNNNGTSHTSKHFFESYSTIQFGIPNDFFWCY